MTVAYLSYLLLESRAINGCDMLRAPVNSDLWDAILTGRLTYLLAFRDVTGTLGAGVCLNLKCYLSRAIVVGYEEAEMKKLLPRALIFVFQY